jgi:hypothetical protein
MHMEIKLTTCYHHLLLKHCKHAPRCSNFLRFVKTVDKRGRATGCDTSKALRNELTPAEEVAKTLDVACHTTGRNHCHSDSKNMIWKLLTRDLRVTEKTTKRLSEQPMSEQEIRALNSENTRHDTAHSTITCSYIYSSYMWYVQGKGTHAFLRQEAKGMVKVKLHVL